MANISRIIILLLSYLCKSIAVPEGCSGIVDLVFLVDGSNSMLDLSPRGDSIYAWKKHQTFMKSVVSELPVGMQSRVAMVSFSSEPNLVFHYDQHSTSINVQDAISAATFPGGNTNTGAAFRAIRATPELKARSSSRKVVVVFTDGFSTIEPHKTLPEAEELKGQNYEMFVVSITDVVNTDLLEFLASEPKDKHVVNVSDIKGLNDELAVTLAHRICGVEDPTSTEATPSCLPGCAICSWEDMMCDKCHHGYYLQNNECIDCMENCGVCDSSQDCHVCKVGWYWEALTNSCEECGVKADLVFVIDSSGSLRDKNPLDGAYDNYQILKNFINNVIDRLDVGPEKTRVGAVLFSSQPSVVFHMDQYLDAVEMKDKINSMPYHGGTTNTAGGIRTMREELFVEARGDRATVRNVGLVITDGESTVDHNLTQIEGQAAKDEGILMYVVGLTNAINVVELKGIASDPDEEYFFESAQIRYLDSIMNSLIKYVCAPNL